MDHHELYPDLAKYLPTYDGKRIETESDYLKRISSTILPNWPEEVLKEWLYRHAPHIDEYSFLGFEKFNFAIGEYRICFSNSDEILMILK